MKDPYQPADLRKSVEMGIAHIANSVDRQRDCRPYFRFNLVESPIWSQHEAADTPHTVGRFLHALNLCAPICGMPEDDELVDGLGRQLLASCAENDGFSWDDMAYEPNPPLAFMHHQREALLGLVALWELRRDERAKSAAKALVLAMEAATRATGTYLKRCLGPKGWQDENFAPTTSERAIGALIAYTRSFADPLGLELAQRFARHALSVSFGVNGELTWASGTHIHSITGTLASLVELGIETAQPELIERARLLFDGGLLPYRSQTGWVKEGTAATYGRGEANCSADMIEAACLLGAAGHWAYYADAERMLRNHLLASQLDDLSWVVENEAMENTATRAHDRLRQRAYGAFCFADPNGFHSYNSDLSGAALQGIAAAWRHIVTADGDGTLRVNLLLSGQHQALDVVSDVPQRGRVAVQVKSRLKRLLVALPPWCGPREVVVKVDGEPCDIGVVDGYLALEDLAEATSLELNFEQARFMTLERVIGHEKPFRVQWCGNAVTAMSGGGRHMALYPPLELG